MQLVVNNGSGNRQPRSDRGDQSKVEMLISEGDAYAIKYEYQHAMTAYLSAADTDNTKALQKCYLTVKEELGLGLILKSCLDAAAKGSPAAFLMLGEMNEHGYGVDKNSVEAAKNYTAAAKLGQSLAARKLLNMFSATSVIEDDFDTAMHCIDEVVSENPYLKLDFACQLNSVALKYYYGEVSHGLTGSEVVQIYAKAGDLGSVHALRNIGGMYEIGRCVGKNSAKAQEFYDYASEKEKADSGCSVEKKRKADYKDQIDPAYVLIRIDQDDLFGNPQTLKRLRLVELGEP